MRDPAGLFPSPAAAEQVLRQAGYSSVTVEASELSRVQRGRTPEQYAAAMWRHCSGFAGLPLAEVLPAEEVRQVEQRFLPAAAQHARRCQVAEGIADPFVMLLVAARK